MATISSRRDFEVLLRSAPSERQKEQIQMSIQGEFLKAPAGNRNLPCQSQELRPRLIRPPESSQHGRSDSRCTWLLHPSHGHAHMTWKPASVGSLHARWMYEGRVRDTHVASMTTATPKGLIASSTARAICLVNLSCT